MEQTEDDPWICKASEIEIFYEKTHKVGTTLLVYQLSLSSIKPLQENDVLTALKHLQRKCPLLRMCFGERDGSVWLRRIINHDLDFEVVHDVEPDDIRHLLHQYQYHSETGPLWCARLLINPKEDGYELDNDHPHTSYLFLGMHHGLGDGTTMIIICGSLMRIINDVISGIPINDEEQIGEFVSDTKNEQLIASKMGVIKSDPNLMEKLRTATGNKNSFINILPNVIPAPECGEDESRYLTFILDAIDTKNFFNKCKAEGVTVNSAFAAVLNTAMVTLLADKNYIKDSYPISNGHLINLRRYWQESNSQALGCHAHLPLILWTEVPRNVIETFWNFTRDLQQNIRHHLKQETLLLMDAFSKMNEKSENVDISQADTQLIDACLSNLGDITGVVTEGGPHVKLYLVTRHISLHRRNIRNISHFFHTFRGRMIISMCYNQKYFALTTVEEYCQSISTIMKKVVNM